MTSGCRRPPATVLLLLLLLLAFPLQSPAADIFLDEQFDGIERWELFSFKNIENRSTYQATDLMGTSCLEASSDNSASALLLSERFDAYIFPMISWRWRISNIYQKGDISKKEGDDAPVRIYVMFEYDPEKASVFKKIKYEVIRALYGKYPPHSSLNYVWSSRKHPEHFLPNPYTDLAMVFPMASGKEDVGKWLEHTANILQDYRSAFGEDPPSIAAIAVMSDSDNTGESARACLDYIRIHTSPSP
ncbi:Protein of unknown function (DUF3047) [Desulfocapsa sulfexigens DSM 10523]|uniref:DUF3047 domain-containing protein n=1 Tax=Desulfocapsa sulfexigens (strain DSM 10523 / SB164P1) TaxID=1167006 RepID=M1PQL9_DESSD|nr:DUF3047 domain-containing protein [Desulfocapsa sulfexigens]AGF78701.1 Protein of unknown function (DUF3047) [Desulfocapsa sulfexigens DSM 10523]